MPLSRSSNDEDQQLGGRLSQNVSRVPWQGPSIWLAVAATVEQRRAEHVRQQHRWRQGVRRLHFVCGWGPPTPAGVRAWAGRALEVRLPSTIVQHDCCHVVGLAVMRWPGLGVGGGHSAPGCSLVPRAPFRLSRRVHAHWSGAPVAQECMTGRGDVQGGSWQTLCRGSPSTLWIGAPLGPPRADVWSSGCQATSKDGSAGAYCRPRIVSGWPA